MNRTTIEQRETGPDAVAIAALSWIAGNADMLNRFLALTGIEASQIRQAAAEPGFLAGVLDFLLAHEPSLMAFSHEAGIDAASVQQARKALRSDAGDMWLST